VLTAKKRTIAAFVESKFMEKNEYISSQAISSMRSLDEQAQRQTTQLAKSSDMDYFWGWAKVFHDEKEHYPVNWGMVFDFVATHLEGNFDPEKEAKLIESKLKKERGRHKVATVKRRLSTLSKEHKNRGHDGHANPCQHPDALKLINDARRSPTHANTPSPAAVKLVVDKVITSISDNLLGICDKAMIYVSFGAGGRRRSELVSLKFSDIVEITDTYYLIEIRGAKNQTYADEVLTVKIEGKARSYLQEWLIASGVGDGYLFRQLTPRGQVVKEEGLSGTQFYRIVKKRSISSGIEYADKFTPHSLRSGFVTEQGKRGKNMYDGMAATGHKSREQYEKYYQSGAAANNEATSFDDT